MLFSRPTFVLTYFGFSGVHDLIIEKPHAPVHVKKSNNVHINIFLFFSFPSFTSSRLRLLQKDVIFYEKLCNR